MTHRAVLTGLLFALAARPESQQQIQAALPALERAYAAQPDVYANAWNLALACYELGRLQEARKSLERLLAVTPTAEAHNLLAAVLEKAGDQKQAAIEFEKAARMEPNEKNIGDWAGFLVRRAALGPAVSIYTHGIRLHPKSQALHIGLGLAYHGMGEYDNAVKWICTAVDLNPADPRPILFLGKLVDTSQKHASDVTDRLANYVRLYPDNPDARLYYALSLLKGAAPADAAKIEPHFMAAARLNPSSFEVRLQMGIFYERIGRNEDAIRALQEAVRLQPGSHAAHYRLARAYQRTGNQQLAAKEFEIVKRLRAKP